MSVNALPWRAGGSARLVALVGAPARLTDWTCPPYASSDALGRARTARPVALEVVDAGQVARIDEHDVSRSCTVHVVEHAGGLCVTLAPALVDWPGPFIGIPHEAPLAHTHGAPLEGSTAPEELTCQQTHSERRRGHRRGADELERGDIRERAPRGRHALEETRLRVRDGLESGERAYGVVGGGEAGDHGVREPRLRVGRQVQRAEAETVGVEQQLGQGRGEGRVATLRRDRLDACPRHRLEHPPAEPQQRVVARREAVTGRDEGGGQQQGDPLGEVLPAALARHVRHGVQRQHPVRQPRRPPWWSSSRGRCRPREHALEQRGERDHVEVRGGEEDDDEQLDPLVPG